MTEPELERRKVIPCGLCDSPAEVVAIIEMEEGGKRIPVPLCDDCAGMEDEPLCHQLLAKATRKR